MNTKVDHLGELIHIHTHTYIHVCTYIYTYTHTHAHTHTYIYTHSYSLTHTHSHIDTSWNLNNIMIVYSLLFCSITNLGGHGIKKFSAIINPPQSAILAVGSLEAVPTLASNGKDFEVTRMMTVTMSCDIRVIDYELACQWLEAFKTVMQCPTTHGLL